MIEKGIAFTIIILAINAVLLIGGVLPADTNLFSWMPGEITPTALNLPTDGTALRPSNIGETSTGTESFMSSIANAVKAIPFLGDVIGWLEAAQGIFAGMLFGLAIAVKYALPPDFYIFAFPFLVIGMLIEIITILWLLFTALGAITGAFS